MVSALERIYYGQLLMMSFQFSVVNISVNS